MNTTTTEYTENLTDPGQDLNLRTSGYEPDELTDRRTPRRVEPCQIVTLT